LKTHERLPFAVSISKARYEPSTCLFLQ
jgi:hypothetical protein